MDVEVTSFSLLRKAWKESCKSSDREHVTPFISRLKNIKKTNLFYLKGIGAHHGQVRVLKSLHL